MAGSHRKSKFAVGGISPHMKEQDRALLMQAKNKKSARAKKVARRKDRLDRRFGRGSHYDTNTPFLN